MNAGAVNLKPDDQPALVQEPPKIVSSGEYDEEEYDYILQTFDKVNEGIVKYCERKKNYKKIVENYELYYSNLVNIYKRDYENFEAEYKNNDLYVKESMEKLSNCRMVKAIEHIIKTHQELQKFKK